MLYTRKGDKGKTGTFGCDQKISKSSAITEALGSLDEANSLIGLLRAEIFEHSEFKLFEIFGRKTAELLIDCQQNLFIIQAEIAGAPGKTISEEKVREIEKIIDSIEQELPPIKSFFIPGATKIGALSDMARTVVRRSERRVVLVFEEGKVAIGAFSLAYLNRLSSLFYAIARLASYKSGINELAPDYR